MYSSTLSLTSALDGSGWLTPLVTCFKPGKETQYPFYRMLGGPPRSVWTGAENLSFTGIRYPDRAAHSGSVYRLSYRGPRPREHCGLKETKIKVDGENSVINSVCVFCPYVQGGSNMTGTICV
jgi:hypothetical protein